MGRIAVDLATAGQRTNDITASHAEIPTAGARTNISGNSAGRPSNEYFGKFKSTIEDLSTQVGQLQDQVAQTVDAYKQAASSQIEHDKSVKTQITQINSQLDPGAKSASAAAPTTKSTKGSGTQGVGIN